MNDIRRVVRIAARRLFLIDLIASAAWALTIVTIVLLVVLLADRLMALNLPWADIALWAAVAGALGTAIWALTTRARDAEVARVLDEKAALRESLSTALCVESANDPWSQAVIDNASAKARRVVVRDALPIEGPRFWQVPLGSLLAFTVLWFLMPSMDLLGKQAERQAQADTQREIQDAKTEATTAIEKAKAILSKSNVDLGSLDGDALDLTNRELDEPTTATEVRNIAMRKLTSLTDELDKKLNDQESKTARSLETMLRQMRTPGQGPLTELARDMARGDMRGAKAKLKQLKDKLESGSLSKEQRDQLAKQLDNVAKQLDKLAKNKSDLEQALRQAGMSAQQASQAASMTPEQLQKALDQMKNMSDEQKQQLAEQAKAMQNAAQQAQNMGQAMQNMSQAMNMDPQAMQQAMQQLGGQLSEMEMSQQDMQAMDQAMQQAMQQLNQLGQANGAQSWAQGQGGNQGMGQGSGQSKMNQPGPTGQWSAGKSTGMGSGSGGPGKGNGQSPDAEATDFMTENIKARVNNQGGPIIGSRLVFGDSIRGESVQEFATAVAQAAEHATSEALEEQLVPREYHESVKSYFGRLERRAKESAAKKPAAKPETKPEPDPE